MVKLFVEGGGDSKELHSRCREGFRKLLEKSGFKGRMPRIVACGSRNSAFSDFENGLSDKEYYPILLVDSEETVNNVTSWEHLKMRDRWNRPVNAVDDQVQMMVTCMEAWIAADLESLKKFFGQSFQSGSIPSAHGLENRSKDEIQSALVSATSQCGHDRKYQKGKRSFQLLGELNPDELSKHLPHFRDFISVLKTRLQIV